MKIGRKGGNGRMDEWMIGRKEQIGNLSANSGVRVVEIFQKHKK
jgi:hypothetical protein